MKKISLFLTVIGISFLMLNASAWAQSRADSGRGRRIHYSKLYNSATVETVRGEVVSLGKTISGNGRTYCQTLTLKTSRGFLRVILKPEGYRPKTDLGLRPRDQVESTGSRVILTGTPILIAARVKKGGNTLILRDLTGRPVWAVGNDWHAH